MVMKRLPIRRFSNGFTLIEVLVVIAIIMVLLSLLGVVAANARIKARISSTKSLVKRIHLSMDEYKAVNGEYPYGDSTSGKVPDLDPATDADFYLGVELDRTWLTDEEPGAKFNNSDYDPSDNNYFVDAWRNRIRYRKFSAERMLIWSYGRNGKDEIGIGQIWDDDTETYGPGKGDGKLERQGDDISMVDVDY